MDQRADIYIFVMMLVVVDANLCITYICVTNDSLYIVHDGQMSNIHFYWVPFHPRCYQRIFSRRCKTECVSYRMRSTAL